MGEFKYRRYVCDGCRARWREEQTNHEGPIYMLTCPVCEIETPHRATRWVQTKDAAILSQPGRSGIVPVKALT